MGLTLVLILLGVVIAAVVFYLTLIVMIGTLGIAASFTVGTASFLVTGSAKVVNAIREYGANNRKFKASGLSPGLPATVRGLLDDYGIRDWRETNRKLKGKKRHPPRRDNDRGERKG